MTAATDALPDTRVARDTEPRARFADLLAAEWLRFWSVRTTPWLLAVFAVAVVGTNYNGALIEVDNWHGAAPDEFVVFRAVRTAFDAVASLLVLLIAGAVGAVAVAGEYASGLARTTFAAVPARRAVVAARAVVVAAVMTGYGLLLTAVSFAATQEVLAGSGIDASLTEPGVVRALAASVLLPPVCALTGMAVGALVRATAGAVVTTVLILVMVPMVFDDGSAWRRAVDQTQVVSAWDRLVMVGPAPGSGWSTMSVAGAWTVYAVWAAAAVLIAVVAVDHRDV